jgi:hypothetical protein
VHRLADSFKMGLKEIRNVGRVHLVRDRDQWWRVLVYLVMNAEVL